MAENPPLILVVEDNRTALMMTEACLKQESYNVIPANNGKMAIDIIKKKYKEIDVILLDRMLPDMDGIELVKIINKDDDLNKLPVIIQTASDSPDQVREGVDAGVFYYLTKPINQDILKSIVASAAKESNQRKILEYELKKHKSSFKLMHSAAFKVNNIDEAEYLACFIANSFPDPHKILPAIAELLVNAVEHGNCGITYEEKTQLIASATWRQEVDKRCALDENKGKVVDVNFLKNDGKCIITISDKGSGFNWRKYLNIDPSRALDNHGRGVARANMLFDSLQYNNEGNQLVAMVDTSKTDTALKW